MSALQSTFLLYNLDLLRLTSSLGKAPAQEREVAGSNPVKVDVNALDIISTYFLEMMLSLQLRCRICMSRLYNNFCYCIIYQKQ